MGCLVNILAIFSILGGLFSILWGLALTGVGGVSWLAGTLMFAEGVQSWGGGEFWAGLLSMVVGVAQIIAGFGLLARAGWAWMLAVIVTVVSLISPVLGLINGSLLSIFGLIFPGIVLLILMSGDVRRQFGRAPS
jgi:hypothetical protein